MGDSNSKKSSNSKPLSVEFSIAIAVRVKTAVLTLLPFLLPLLRPTAPQVGCSNDCAKLHVNSQLMLLFFFPPSAFASVKIQPKLVSSYFLISPNVIVLLLVLNSKFRHLVHVVLTPLRMWL